MFCHAIDRGTLINTRLNVSAYVPLSIDYIRMLFVLHPRHWCCANILQCSHAG